MVPALLAWVDGNREQLSDLASQFLSDAPALVQQLSQDAAAGDFVALGRRARDLHRLLVPFGLSQLCASIAMIEDLDQGNYPDLAVPLVAQLRSAIDDLCAYLAQEPWLHT